MQYGRLKSWCKLSSKPCIAHMDIALLITAKLLITICTVNRQTQFITFMIQECTVEVKQSKKVQRERERLNKTRREITSRNNKNQNIQMRKV